MSVWGRCPCSLFIHGVLLSRALVVERFAERDFVVRITSGVRTLVVGA